MKEKKLISKSIRAQSSPFDLSPPPIDHDFLELLHPFGKLFFLKEQSQWVLMHGINYGLFEELVYYSILTCLWNSVSLNKGCYKGQETISRLIT
ncbi:uncharacterized protein LOC114421794 isoform X2 [Glycine soja]|uniref:uncharacterized protein isoform X2 n=1 Tax=Glycine max TaxID=3847 RepID=UPI00071916E5|nr:uncharacterized protein LOC100788895 isoform X2 [Glycine max]XP_028243668.1 uncharacterized protein LOC114421794 isoform X2 [Glycine soja]|eukprot:XP_014634408.1 uncharacterized protein LOC100788895 isoform X2 [Glycine max]